ncbi:MAG: HTH domain-containing protein [Thermomicrobiales bacterium]
MPSKTTRDLERWVAEHEDEVEEKRIAWEAAQSQLDGLRAALAISKQKDESEPEATTPKELANLIYEVLEEAGEPLHYGIIHDRILARGIEIPGKDTKRNVNAHLSNDQRFERLGKGIWRLKREGWAHVTSDVEPDATGVRSTLRRQDEDALQSRHPLQDRVRAVSPLFSRGSSPLDDDEPLDGEKAPVPGLSLVG